MDHGVLFDGWDCTKGLVEGGRDRMWLSEVLMVHLEIVCRGQPSDENEIMSVDGKGARGGLSFRHSSGRSWLMKHDSTTVFPEAFCVQERRADQGTAGPRDDCPDSGDLYMMVDSGDLYRRCPA